jgi:hypothetical protein
MASSHDISAKSSSRVQLEMAYIASMDTPGLKVEFLFNPKEYKITRQVGWEGGRQKGTNVPEVEFSSGKPRTLTLSIFADTYEAGRDVRKEFVEKLEKLTMVNKSATNDKKPRPDNVYFGWGATIWFPAVIKQLDVTYTLFHPDGRPARCNISLVLQEVKAERKPQNPTSAGQEGRRSHVVLPGETLDVISYLELGDSSKWRYLAELNGIDDPFGIRPGQQLVVMEPS